MPYEAKLLLGKLMIKAAMVICHFRLQYPNKGTLLHELRKGIFFPEHFDWNFPLKQWADKVGFLKGGPSTYWQICPLLPSLRDSTKTAS